MSVFPGWGHGLGSFPVCPRAPLGKPNPEACLWAQLCVLGRGDPFPCVVPDASLSTDHQSRSCAARPRSREWVWDLHQSPVLVSLVCEPQGRGCDLVPLWSLRAHTCSGRGGSLPCPSIHPSIYPCLMSGLSPPHEGTSQHQSSPLLPAAPPMPPATHSSEAKLQTGGTHEPRSYGIWGQESPSQIPTPPGDPQATPSYNMAKGIEDKGGLRGFCHQQTLET